MSEVTCMTPVVVQLVDTHNGESVDVTSGALAVYDNDVYKELVNEHFHLHTGVSENVAIASSAGDISITVDDGSVFSVGDFVQIEEGTTVENDFPQITIIATDLLTFDRPMDNAFTVAATIEVVNINLAAIAGSLGTPIAYIVKPPSDEVWKIARILITIGDDDAMDDGKFGGITALTNGVVVRESNGDTNRLTVWKTNGDMAEDMYDVAYSDANLGPAGENGLRGRWTFKKSDIAIELDGSLPGHLEILIQDDITGLSTFMIKAQGHKQL
ncbi:MAG: hypothetical protein KAS32_29695 [Candidatus Peribacteraceae bacterium]|nr:hypothetical protein [Candidatus Peribacteraceae bacterium]